MSFQTQLKGLKLPDLAGKITLDGLKESAKSFFNSFGKPPRYSSTLTIDSSDEDKLLHLIIESGWFPGDTKRHKLSSLGTFLFDISKLSKEGIRRARLLWLSRTLPSSGFRANFRQILKRRLRYSLAQFLVLISPVLALGIILGLLRVQAFLAQNQLKLDQIGLSIFVILGLLSLAGLLYAIRLLVMLPASHDDCLSGLLEYREIIRLRAAIRRKKSQSSPGNLVEIDDEDITLYQAFLNRKLDAIQADPSKIQIAHATQYVLSWELDRLKAVLSAGDYPESLLVVWSIWPNLSNDSISKPLKAILVQALLVAIRQGIMAHVEAEIRYCHLMLDPVRWEALIEKAKKASKKYAVPPAKEFEQAMMNYFTASQAPGITQVSTLLNHLYLTPALVKEQPRRLLDRL